MITIQAYVIRSARAKGRYWKGQIDQASKDQWYDDVTMATWFATESQAEAALKLGKFGTDCDVCAVELTHEQYHLICLGKNRIFVGPPL